MTESKQEPQEWHYLMECGCVDTTAYQKALAAFRESSPSPSEKTND
jgi:hypothetical protein